MTKTFECLRSVAWISLLLLLVSPGIAGHNAIDQGAIAQVENLIAMHVTGSDGVDVTATVIEGGAFSIQDMISGERIIFYPSVSKANRQNVKINLVQGFDLKDKSLPYATDAMHVEKQYDIDVTLGSGGYKLSNNIYTIEISAIIKRLIAGQNQSTSGATKQGSTIVPLNEDGGGGGGDVCIFCNGKMYCSNCAIWTACGCVHTAQCSC